MVKTRKLEHAKINIAATKAMINTIFGKTLTLRVVTETVDDFGQLSNITTADTTFTGDLQFGLDLKKEYVEWGLVEVGDAVLYLYPDALTTLPTHKDIIVDGNSEWEVIDQIEAPELQGSDCHYSYRCKRRPETSDN